MFTEVLEDRHVVFGVRFRPGGFRPFLGAPVGSISGRFIPIGDIFGPPGTALERPVVEAPTTAEMVDVVESFLVERMPPPDPMVDFVTAVVADAAKHPDLIRVADLARRWEVTMRNLQRLFAEYVGAGPKWVIRRYRMQDVVARAAVGPVDWARIAAELGYSDQAHFCRALRRHHRGHPVALHPALCRPTQPGVRDRRRRRGTRASGGSCPVGWCRS